MCRQFWNIPRLIGSAADTASVGRGSVIMKGVIVWTDSMCAFGRSVVTPMGIAILRRTARKLLPKEQCSKHYTNICTHGGRVCDYLTCSHIYLFA